MERHTTLLVAALMLVGFTAPAAAQQTSTDAQVEAKASTSSGVFGSIMSKLNSISDRLAQIEQRLTSVEKKVDAKANANVDVGPSNRDKAEKGKSAKASAGAQVNHSVNVENGTKTVKHEVKKDGETIVDFVKNIFVGDSEETEAQAEIEARVEGNVSANQNVSVIVERNGTAVENAEVEVNGEVVGKTDAEGQIKVTVPESEEFEVEVEKADSETELKFRLEAEAESESSEDSNGSKAEVKAETSLNAEVGEDSVSSESDVSAGVELR